MKKRFSLLFIFSLSMLSLATAQTQKEKEEVESRKKALHFVTPSAEQIKKDFATNGYNGVHPRLFCTQKEIDRAKRLIAEGDTFMIKAWERLKGIADKNLTLPPEDGSLDAAQLRVKGTHANAVALPPMVIAYHMTGDTKYAEQVWKVFENMSTWNDWGTLIEPPYTDRHYLDTGIAAFDVALVWDGIYDWMTPLQRDFVYEQAMKFLFIPTEAQYKGTAKRTWQWNKANNNWNGICNGGVVMACLSMFERNAELFSWMSAQAIADMPHYIREFEPHGQSEEGLMYWGYGLMYTLPSLDMMWRVLGSTYGLADTPGMKKAGYFPVLTSGPVVSLSIGDDPLKKGRSKSFFWPSVYNKDASLARLQYDMVVENEYDLPWFDFFYFDPVLVAQGEKIEVPLDNKVYGLELMSMVERWNDPNALYVAIHGGYNSANHGHLDAGSFDLQALGEVWAYGNLGRDDYTFPGYFSKRSFPEYDDAPTPQKEAGRWHFYRLRAEGKNCLVFNPSTLPDQCEMGTARIIRQASSPAQSSFTFDLTECYRRDVKQYERTVMMDRRKHRVRITDTFQALTPSQVWWSMHTKAAIEIAADGRSALLKQNGKQMRVSIASPSGLRFDVLPATYLPGVEFLLTKNSSNKEFRKLVIRGDKMKKATIAVEFEPLYPSSRK